MDMDKEIKELKKAIEKVKVQLWGWGYGVKDVTKIPGITYHLLVNEKHRVFVRTAAQDVSKFAKNDDGSFAYEDGCDIVACVEGKQKAYMKAKQPQTATMRPYEVMDLDK